MNGRGSITWLWPMGLWPVAVVLALPALPTAAQEPGQAARQATRTIADFAGTWRGGGMAEDVGGGAAAVTMRDLEVTISPERDGFRLAWTTVVHGADPAPYRREATLTFRPTDRPNVFGAAGSGNPMEGGTLSWARLHGATLSVYQIVLNESGGFELTSTDRTLDESGGESGMALVFRRLSDGQPVRTATGRLERVGG